MLMRFFLLPIWSPIALASASFDREMKRTHTNSQHAELNATLWRSLSSFTVEMRELSTSLTRRTFGVVGLEPKHRCPLRQEHGPSIQVRRT